MPSAAARELDGKVSRVIADAGATIIERRTCGSGHNKVVFARGGEQRMFHYAKTPSDGRGTKNAIADLRRILKELPKASEKPQEPREAPKRTTAVRYRPSAQPTSKKLTAARSKEIAKTYLTCASLEELCENEDLTQMQAETLILSLKGDAALKLKKEKNHKKHLAAKKRREPSKPKRKKFVRLSRKETAARNRRIYVYHYYGMDLREIGKLYNLSEERVRQIVRAAEKRTTE